MGNINFTNFVVLPSLFSVSEENTAERIRVDIYINPLNVMYFYPVVLDNKNVVSICVGGRLFYLDMQLDEFLKIWDEVKRGLEIDVK